MLGAMRERDLIRCVTLRSMRGAWRGQFYREGFRISDGGLSGEPGGEVAPPPGTGQRGCLSLSEVEGLAERFNLGDDDLEDLYRRLEEEGIAVTDDCGRVAETVLYANGEVSEATADRLTEPRARDGRPGRSGLGPAHLPTGCSAHSAGRKTLARARRAPYREHAGPGC